ncbi:helix-turn-helix domain-containing protein [Peribacillus muralis]|uniref:XRE family transcriptional regulator n=1 Tax=Peribacillus muralis TaxID=264697 RepID=A0A1B3XUE7_9BACI|nr:helix-turn-helix transcriptional regulator [Peribacillus muralis]AOH56827.1 XRE family transcriptional regulator [Peribacillus muralis]
MFRFLKGKPRSKIGKFIDKHGYSQEEFVVASGISRNTISRVCSDPKYVPSAGVLKKIMKAIRSIEPHAKSDDYFDI